MTWRWPSTAETCSHRQFNKIRSYGQLCFDRPTHPCLVVQSFTPMWADRETQLSHWPSILRRSCKEWVGVYSLNLGSVTFNGLVRSSSYICLFIDGLFSDALNYRRMGTNNEPWIVADSKEAIVAQFKVISPHFVDGLRTATNNVSQDMQCPC